MKLFCKSKFTLLELLIILAIISLLSAILLPTISSMREKSRRSIDINNMKQLGIAIFLYSQDNDGALPYVSNSISDSRCLFLLLPYLNNSISLFYPPIIYDQRKSDPGFTAYINKPNQLIADIKLGISTDLVYPGYAYTSVDTGGIPLNDKKLSSNTAIITNINGTYKDMNNILLMDGSMYRVSGNPATNEE